MIIDIYAHEGPASPRDSLMSAIQVGDADELHNAVIVLCEIAERQQAQIDSLTRRLESIDAARNA
jgi:hypothetical protein